MYVAFCLAFIHSNICLLQIMVHPLSDVHTHISDLTFADISGDAFAGMCSGQGSRRENIQIFTWQIWQGK